MVRCPQCNSEVYYVQDVTEYHSFDLLDNDDDFVDLIALVDSVPNNDKGYRLHCSQCPNQPTMTELRQYYENKTDSCNE